VATTFAWRGRNARGELVQGQLDALGENAVADQLVAMGVSPVHIAAATVTAEATGDNWWTRLNRKGIKI
jgi:MSHA biogenesis protein MshG